MPDDDRTLDDQTETDAEADVGTQNADTKKEPPAFTEDDIRELMEYREGRHVAFKKILEDAAKEVRDELARYQVPGMGMNLFQLYQQLVTGGAKGVSPGAVPPPPGVAQGIVNPFEDVRRRLEAIEQTLATMQGQTLEQRFESAIAGADWASDPALKEFAANYVIAKMRDDQQNGRVRPLNEYVAAFNQAVDRLAQRRLQGLAPKERPPTTRVPRPPEVPEPDHVKKIEDEIEALLAEAEGG